MMLYLIRLGKLDQRLFSASVIALIGACLFIGNPDVAAVEDNAEDPGPRVLNLEILPGTVTNDPGPQAIYGKNKHSTKGTIFQGVDISLRGGVEAYRVYFDLVDNSNYHFLDRRGDKLELGICEEGLEQVYVKGVLPANDQDSEIRIARRETTIGVFQGHVLILSAFNENRFGGVTGVRGLSIKSSKDAEGTPKVKAKMKWGAQAREEIHFSDDFMREDKDSSVWQKVGCGKSVGDFSIKSLNYSLLSANPFCYMAEGRNIKSLAGPLWWDNYVFETSLRGPAKARIGLIFAYKDEKNYGLFRWTSRTQRTDGVSNSNTGTRELVRVLNGEEYILAQDKGGYIPQQWYQARISVSYRGVRVAVDGHLLFEERDPYLTAGKVGFWCHTLRATGDLRLPKQMPTSKNTMHHLMKQHAVFDDITVKTHKFVEDDFLYSGSLAGGWLVGTGTWQVVGSKPEGGAAEGELQVSPVDGPSKSLIGKKDWSQYRVSCDVVPGEGGAGLVFLYRDESNYYRVEVDRENLVLVRVRGGDEKEIAKTKVNALAEGLGSNAEFVRLRASVRSGHIKVTSSDGSVVECFDSQRILRGRAGLWAGVVSSGPVTRFKRFRLTFLPDPQPLVTTNAVFQYETQTMKSWNDPKSEWSSYPKSIEINGQRVVPQWHRGQFPGDVEIGVEPREILEDRHEVALALGKNGNGSYNGYTFRYRAGLAGADTESGKKGTKVILMRQGVVVAEKEIAEVRELSSLSFRRAGKYVIAKVNGLPMLSYKDDKPLHGSRVAYYAQGVTLRNESTKIHSGKFHDDLFSTAPFNWRTAGAAIFQVTNRWQCDPRWTFACLENDRRRGNVAVLWSKKLYPGDMTIEFFAGNKMDLQRGRPYKYARDFNVTICSDGQDLSKGYTFMFGGDGNKGSMIYRNGVVVKRDDQVKIPVTMNFHRHWFAIRIEKKGNRVAFQVDRYFTREPQGELVYEDSQPLTGNRVAIWTYNHGMMISRVRISGDGDAEKEHPDFDIKQLRTIYKKP